METENFSLGFKYNRVLSIYTKLINGDVVNKAEEAKRFNVNPKSIQRDIEDLRCFFEEQASNGELAKELVYSKELNGYHLVNRDVSVLSNSEVFAVCKILLESRAFTRKEMTPIINKLLSCCVPPKSHNKVKELILNEMFHYTELNHHKEFVDSIWEIGDAVYRKCYLKLSYKKMDGRVVERVVKPVGIMFSEFYFYLTAFIENIDREKEFHNKNDLYPTIYRIDRIQEFEFMEEHFEIPYKDRFEEGEFRKRVQFMYGGELRRIKFLYKGKNVEAVLDRLPTASVVERKDDGVVISAEVFGGNGVDMWIRSQGESVEMIE
ncbi:MAG: WYL domain-containing protein [Ruminococcus sp.]|nr:WYL domain-containing protein [Ruminococcus sp.]